MQCKQTIIEQQIDYDSWLIKGRKESFRWAEGLLLTGGRIASVLFGHFEGYVLVVKSDVKGVVFTDGKPFGSRGYRVRRHISQLKRSTFPIQSLQAQEKGQQKQES